MTLTVFAAGLLLASSNSGDYKAGQVFGAIILLILGGGFVAWAVQRMVWVRRGSIQLSVRMRVGVWVAMIVGLFVVAADVHQVVARGFFPASSNRSASSTVRSTVLPAATLPPFQSAPTESTLVTLPRLGIDNSIPVVTGLRATVMDYPSTGYLSVVLDWTQPAGYADAVVYRGDNSVFADSARIVYINAQPGHAFDTSVQHGHRYNYFVTVARDGGSTTSLPVLTQVNVP